jgi:hypothetical protein
MLSRTFKFIAILAVAASAIATPYDALSPGTLAEFIRRDASQITVSCTQPGVSGCVCPLDLNGDDGVLINVFPVSQQWLPKSVICLTGCCCSSGLPVHI